MYAPGEELPNLDAALLLLDCYFAISKPPWKSCTRGAQVRDKGSVLFIFCFVHKSRFQPPYDTTIWAARGLKGRVPSRLPPPVHASFLGSLSRIGRVRASPPPVHASSLGSPTFL